jgi:hypothetical protein
VASLVAAALVGWLPVGEAPSAASISRHPTTTSGGRLADVTMIAAKPSKPSNDVGRGVILSSVSCPSETHCVAGGEQRGQTTGGVAYFSANGGTSWSKGTLPASLPDGTFWKIACPTSSHCVAAFDASSGSSNSEGGGVVLLTTDGGAVWSEEKSSAEAGFGSGFISGISCPTVAHCVATGDDGREDNITTVSTDGGVTWSPGTQTGPHSGVSCPTESRCVGTGGLISTDGGSSWSNGSSSSPNAPETGISCPTVSHCVGFGASNSGAIAIFTTNGGSSWIAGTVPADLNMLCVGGGETGQCVNDVACPSVSLCVTVGGGGAMSSPHAIAMFSKNGGASWSWAKLPIGVVGLFGMTCPTTKRCVAVGAIGPPSSPEAAVFFSNDGGATWGGLNGNQPVQTRPVTRDTTTSQPRTSVPHPSIALLTPIACASVASSIPAGGCVVGINGVSSVDMSYVNISVSVWVGNGPPQGTPGSDSGDWEGSNAIVHYSAGTWHIVAGPGSTLAGCGSTAVPAAVIASFYSCP